MANTIQITVQNLAAVQKAFAEIGDKARDNVAIAVKATGMMLVTDIKRRYKDPPKTGRLYRKSKGTIHRASAPGEAPAIDTGYLTSRIFTTEVSPLAFEVYTKVPYGYYLEFGTRKTPRILRRPAWIPAVEKHRPIFEELVEEAIRKAAE